MRFPALHPAQLRLLATLALTVLLIVLTILIVEFVLQGSAGLVHRLTGRPPPKRTWMAAEIDRIASRLRDHDRSR